MNNFFSKRHILIDHISTCELGNLHERYYNVTETSKDNLFEMRKLIVDYYGDHPIVLVRYAVGLSEWISIEKAQLKSQSGKTYICLKPSRKEVTQNMMIKVHKAPIKLVLQPTEDFSHFVIPEKDSLYTLYMYNKQNRG